MAYHHPFSRACAHPESSAYVFSEFVACCSKSMAHNMLSKKKKERDLFYFFLLKIISAMASAAMTAIASKPGVSHPLLNPFGRQEQKQHHQVNQHS